MPADVTKDEFDRLVGRVDVLEDEVEGEKTVTRHILEQVRRNSDDLAAIKGRLGRVESDVAVLKTDVAVLKTDVAVLKTDVAVLKADVGGLKTDVGGLKADLRGLRDELPRIVADTMREVLNERDGRS